MVKAVMNAVYVAIGLAFARKIYEKACSDQIYKKACSDPYVYMRRSSGQFHYHDLDMIIGRPNAGKNIIKEILETSRQIERGSMGVVPVVTAFQSTPNPGNSRKPFPWSPMDKEL